MKKITALLLVAIFSVTVFACTPAAKKSYLKVKCPACGHEFEKSVE
jgi:hypothetical protein